MQATRPDVEVPGDNERDLNYMPPYPIKVKARSMARSGDCLGMSEYWAVWRFGYTFFSEKREQTGVYMPNHFLWILADRRSGVIVERWKGIAADLPNNFRRVLDWGD